MRSSQWYEGNPAATQKASVAWDKLGLSDLAAHVPLTSDSGTRGKSTAQPRQVGGSSCRTENQLSICVLLLLSH